MSLPYPIAKARTRVNESEAKTAKSSNGYADWNVGANGPSPGHLQSVLDQGALLITKGNGMTNREFAGVILRHKGKISVATEINNSESYVYVEKKDLAGFFERLGDTPCIHSLEPDGGGRSYLARND